MKESIKAADVSYVASLAHLDLTSEEQARMVRDLNSILGFIDSLSELDTKDVPPMAQVTASEASPTGTLREDTLVPSLPHDAALRNSPLPDANFFKVPKVIER
jgi:aspartyl-tRNA(Asn)/glutamyl-tRNA(Gln) amidotransferase subunit C